MAKDAKPADEGAETPAPKKSKKLLIIILAAVLVLVIGGGAAAFLLMKKGADHTAEDEDGTEETVTAKKKDKKSDAPPSFFGLEPFTVNLIPETGDQYLQVALSLELEDSQAESAIKTQMPKIRNNLTLLLSSKKASEILTKDGKQELALALKDEINSLIEPPVKNKKGEVKNPAAPVKSVLFTSFIIQ